MIQITFRPPNGWRNWKIKSFITVCAGKANDVRTGSRSGLSEDYDLTSNQAHFLVERMVFIQVNDQIFKKFLWCKNYTRFKLQYIDSPFHLHIMDADKRGCTGAHVNWNIYCGDFITDCFSKSFHIMPTQHLYLNVLRSTTNNGQTKPLINATTNILIDNLHNLALQINLSFYL